MITNPTAKSIFCYGDSNTWGRNSEEPSRYPADVRWTGLLQRSLGNNYYVIEAGLSGRTTDLDYPGKRGRNGKTSLESCLYSHLPIDIVALMLGTNDLKVEFHRSPEDIAHAIAGLVRIVYDKTTYERDKPAEVILMSPILVNDSAPHFVGLHPPKAYDQSSAAKSRQLAGAIQTVAAEMDCTFINVAGIASAGSDGIHLSAVGHRALAATMTDTIRGMA